MSNPFGDIPVGGNYVKLKQVNESVQGTIVALRKGLDFDKVNEVPEIVLNVNGEEKVLSCENANLKTWAVTNGETLAASVGAMLTVTLTGFQVMPNGGSAKIFDCQIGAAPAAPVAPATAPATPLA